MRTWFTLGFQRVGGNHVFFDTEENRVAVELVELRLQESDREGARKRGNTLAQRRTMSKATFLPLPSVWNSLPPQLTADFNSVFLSSLKRNLKTHFYRLSFKS